MLESEDGKVRLDLHRELCAAVRQADQAFARFYVAAPGSDAARQQELRYYGALAQARAALGALEKIAAAEAPRSPLHGAEIVESARQVC